MRVVTVTMNPAADLIVELPSLRLDAVNKALDKLRADGTLKKLSEKYFNADVTQ